eukprot:scaffold14600_cov91-Skeletonema_marinoi.AAC.3
MSTATALLWDSCTPFMYDVVWLFYGARSSLPSRNDCRGMPSRIVCSVSCSPSQNLIKRGHKEQFRISCPLSPHTLQSSCFPLSYPRTMPTFLA